MNSLARFSRFAFLGLLLASHVLFQPAETAIAEGTSTDGVASTKIWDQAPHNAFTDLIRWNDRFYCTFREGERHVHGADGKVRVIASDDGKDWESVALIEEEGVDLRDSKLSITPDGRLMVVMGGSTYKNRNLVSRLSRVVFLEPGHSTQPKSIPVVIDPKVATNNDWLWRVVWKDGVGYGGVYQAFYEPGTRKGASNPENRPWAIHMVKTTDGVNYDLVKSFDLEGKPGESTPLFLDDGSMLYIVRNGEISNLGQSKPPYSDWEWKKLETHLGGPNLIQLPSKSIVLGTRWMRGSEKKDRRTILGTLTPEGKFARRVVLPSGGDTSYPGMLLYDGKLWVSYYSSHEDKASIYLAQIPLDVFEPQKTK